jgi:hypothetical protein
MDPKEFERALTEAERAARQLKEELTRARALVAETRAKLRDASTAVQPPTREPRLLALFLLRSPGDLAPAPPGDKGDGRT